MRSTRLTLSLLIVVGAVASTALAVDSYMEFVGTGATVNYNVPTNWNELVLSDPNDPSSPLILDPNVTRVPTNDNGTQRREDAFIRNGTVVTVSTTVPNIAALSVGEAGDVTKDAGGTIQPRSGSTVVINPGGNLTVSDYQGTGWPSPHTSSIGASYDGTLHINGGQFKTNSNLFIGTNGSPNPDGQVPYQGTGTLRVTSGQFSVGTNGSFLYIGSGHVTDTSGKGVKGIATYDGGNINVFTSSVTWVGYDGAEGTLTVNQTDPYNPTVVNSPDAALIVGSNGHYEEFGGGYDPNWRSTGVYIQNGGSAVWGGLNVGRTHGDGTFILNGGTCVIATENEARIGNGGGNVGQVFTRTASGVGHMIINGGYFESNNERTKFIVGRGEVVGNTVAPGNGRLTINGGYVLFYRQQEALNNCLEIANVDYSHTQGTLEVFGGTLDVNKRVLFAKNNDCTGVFHMGKDGYAKFGWLAMYEVERPPTNSVVKMIVEVAADRNSVVNVIRDVVLKGELEVRGDGWRPKEGDRFQIIKQDRWLSQPISTDFNTITSDITKGLPLGYAFNGIIVPADPNGGTEPNPGYVVEFVGLTAGDANGDHIVNAGDLALMGGSWMKSGKDWANGNFTEGDDVVDAGDLALMGGNWMWSLPSSPPPPTSLPEPATLVLLSLGGVAFLRRRR